VDGDTGVGGMVGCGGEVVAVGLLVPIGGRCLPLTRLLDTPFVDRSSLMAWAPEIGPGAGTVKDIGVPAEEVADKGWEWEGLRHGVWWCWCCDRPFVRFVMPGWDRGRTNAPDGEGVWTSLSLAFPLSRSSTLESLLRSRSRCCCCCNELEVCDDEMGVANASIFSPFLPT
jgi:hypothetical protein